MGSRGWIGWELTGWGISATTTIHCVGRRLVGCFESWGTALGTAAVLCYWESFTCLSQTLSTLFERGAMHFFLLLFFLLPSGWLLIGTRWLARLTILS
jgi:hypothetical protein